MQGEYSIKFLYVFHCFYLRNHAVCETCRISGCNVSVKIYINKTVSAQYGPMAGFYDLSFKALATTDAPYVEM